MSLNVQGLCKTFTDHLTLKKKQVLFDVSFAVPEGSVTGFLGSNGAGKTTTIKSILSLLRFERGNVEFFSGNLKDPKSQIGYLPERPYFYEYLTGMEFLLFYGQLSMSDSKIQIKEKAKILLKRVGLEHAENTFLRSYSKGMLQRIGLAQALIHKPRFLILDEPMSGLDPDGRYQVTQIIQEVAASGATIFFSSHLLTDVERLCDRLVIIDYGKIIYEGLQKNFLTAGDGGYEVTYTPQDSATVAIKNCKDLSEVTEFLNQIKSQNASLLEVKQPRVTLEEAFNQIKKQHSQQREMQS
ncbi:MAG: ABC transporter ATP-binding protein [Bdellovibrionales bacterium]|nr:ABC transporter ATP-binding protein [Bdellovibrionales bacterium]